MMLTPAPDTRAPAVILVDDHDLFRAGLRTLIEGQGLRVVGDTRCDPSAIEMARRTKATVALVDTSTADGASNAHLVAALVEQLPDIGVAIFTRSLERVDIFHAVRAGARAYVAKNAPVEDLAAAIRAVHGGAAWMSPEVLATTLDFLHKGNLPLTTAAGMSEREVEVLQLVAVGLENNEIAVKLGISSKTVKNHVSSILMKLSVSNRVQAAIFAVRSGLA
ncbi:MAG: response regulator transcription factor [Thermoleophilia bacterium]|nr:response regulator transcription factor [Thermoleophilia bacterium]